MKPLILLMVAVSLLVCACGEEDRYKLAPAQLPDIWGGSSTEYGACYSPTGCNYIQKKECYYEFRAQQACR